MVNTKAVAVLGLAAALVVAFAPMASANHAGIDPQGFGQGVFWSSYEVPNAATMTPVIGLASSTNDPASLTNDGAIDQGGKIVGTAVQADNDPWPEYPIQGHTVVNMKFTDDVANNVAGDLCQYGRNNDNTCVQETRAEDEIETDAQLDVCSGQQTITLDYSDKWAKAKHNIHHAEDDPSTVVNEHVAWSESSALTKANNHVYPSGQPHADANGWHNHSTFHPADPPPGSNEPAQSDMVLGPTVLFAAGAGNQMVWDIDIGELAQGDPGGFNPEPLPCGVPGLTGAPTGAVIGGYLNPGAFGSGITFEYTAGTPNTVGVI